MALYDFYLIFHESDSSTADEILEHFENQANGGFRGFHPERDGIYGTYTNNLTVALEQSRKVFILLSNNSFESGWFKIQMEASLCHHIITDGIRIIPIYLDNVNSPILQVFVGVLYEAEDFWTRIRQALDH